MNAGNPKASLSADPSAIGGNRTNFSGSDKSKSYIWVGRIAHVDVEQMKCSIRLDSGTGELHNISITAPGGAGPSSFSGSIPEIGTRVLIGWAKLGLQKYKAIILGYLTSSVVLGRDHATFSSIDPSEAAYAREVAPELDDDPEKPLQPRTLRNRKAYPGDFIATSSAGSDILVDRDITLTNRSGVEVALRDADQTIVSNSINTYSVTSAGVRVNGLIKRNAFNFLPDVYPVDTYLVDKPFDISPDAYRTIAVSEDTPAFRALFEQRLIDENGLPNFRNEFYKYVTESDGVRASYVYSYPLDNTSTYDDHPDLAYTEDRLELRHTTDGIMSVTAETDGFNVEYNKNNYIEDVAGTIVGNDPYTDHGRKFYKKVLGARIFNGPSDKAVAPGLTYTDLNADPLKPQLLDTVALAKLFKIQSPTSSNEYSFAVTKEGRVYLNIPSSITGAPEEVGRSLDANISGLVKAVIGADPNFDSTSLDLVTKGGINLDVGANSGGVSLNIILRGRIKKVYTSEGDGSVPVLDDQINGSASRTVTGTAFESVSASKSTYVGGTHNVSAFGKLNNIGPGGYTNQVAGDFTNNVLGSESKTVALDSKHTYLVGQTVLIPIGLHSSTALAGGFARTVVSGTGITDTVTAGAYTTTVTSGTYTATVASGTMALSVASGPISIAATAGPISIASLTNTITGSTSNVFSAPTTKIGSVVTGVAVAGVPGPGGPHLDYITGLPLLGIPTIAIG